MSEILDKRNDLSVINALPAVIPPTTRFNFIKNWWHRSEKSSSIAEARIIQRIYTALPETTTIGIPTFARIGKISLDKEVTTKTAREVNTLYISQQPKQETAFQFESEAPHQLQEIISKDLEENPTDKNLVMCHGYGAGLGFFYRNYASLSQEPGWRVFSIDWLGMGNSSRPKWTLNRKSNQTWDEIVEHVEEHFVESLEDWRKKVGLDKMTLFGHSLGGYFATCYALKYPQRVEKLILVSPAGIPESTPAVVKQQEEKEASSSPQETLQKEASEINASYQADAAAVENIAKQQQQQEEIPQNVRRKMPSWATYLWDRNVTPMSIVRMVGPFGPGLVHTYTSRRFAHLNEAEQHDLYDYTYQISSSTGSGEFALAAILAPGAYARKPLFRKLGDLKMPTVFIYGEQDWMDYKAAERAKEFMKVPVKVIRIPEGGHHMYLENPIVFNEAVRAEMK